MLGVSQDVFDKLNMTDAQQTKLMDIGQWAHNAEIAATNGQSGGATSSTARAAIEKVSQQAHERAMALLTASQLALIQQNLGSNPQAGPGAGGPNSGPPGGGTPPGMSSDNIGPPMGGPPAGGNGPQAGGSPPGGNGSPP
jgi:hypothetical protein